MEGKVLHKYERTVSGILVCCATGSIPGINQTRLSSQPSGVWKQWTLGSRVGKILDFRPTGGRHYFADSASKLICRQCQVKAASVGGAALNTRHDLRCRACLARDKGNRTEVHCIMSQARSVRYVCENSHSRWFRWVRLLVLLKYAIDDYDSISGRIIYGSTNKCIS